MAADRLYCCYFDHPTCSIRTHKCRFEIHGSWPGPGFLCQTAIAGKNTGLRREAGTDKMTVTDSSGQKQTLITKGTTTTLTKVGGPKSSREGTPARTEPLKHTFLRQTSPKASGQPQSKVSSSGYGKAKSPPARELKNGQKSSRSGTASELRCPLPGDSLGGVPEIIIENSVLIKLIYVT